MKVCHYEGTRCFNGWVPIQAALQALGSSSESADMLAALKAVRTASLNCYIFEVRSKHGALAFICLYMSCIL